MLLGKHSGACQIIDPAESYKIIFSSISYEEAKLWLLEDEYERVDGRLLMEVENDDTSTISDEHIS
jgi:hypothetical protein